MAYDFEDTGAWDPDYQYEPFQDPNDPNAPGPGGPASAPQPYQSDPGITDPTYLAQTQAREQYFNSPLTNQAQFAQGPQDYADQGRAPNTPSGAGGTVDPYARMAFQQAWQGSAGHTREDLQRLIASDPRFAGITQSGASGDIVNLPGYSEAGTGIYRGPESLDVIGDVGGANSWAWSGLGGPGGGGGGGQGGQGMAGAAGLPGGPGGAFGAERAGGAGGANVDPELRAALLRLMARNEPGDINVQTDPNLAPQARAYSTARQRGASREREALAERAAFGGFNPGGAGSGAFTSGVADIGERAGEDIAGQQAGLVGQEVQARRNDLQNSLQLANAIGARDQSTQLQQQLADLDNKYRYASLGQQESQFGRNLGFQQGQWNDQYGLNLAEFKAKQDRDALIAALRGE